MITNSPAAPKNSFQFPNCYVKMGEGSEIKLGGEADRYGVRAVITGIVCGLISELVANKPSEARGKCASL